MGILDNELWLWLSNLYVYSWIFHDKNVFLSWFFLLHVKYICMIWGISMGLYCEKICRCNKSILLISKKCDWCSWELWSNFLKFKSENMLAKQNGLWLRTEIRWFNNLQTSNYEMNTNYNEIWGLNHLSVANYETQSRLHKS